MDLDDFNAASRAQWDRKAGFWDQRMAEGNQTQRLLLRPAVERMLAPQRGQLVLEAACGNGVFSRWLAGLGARVVAFDFSAALVARARARTAVEESVEYHVADATDVDAVLTVAAGRRFDAALCAQALHDMADISPLMRALAEVLKPDAPFVVTVPHPAFNFAGAAPGMEQHDLPDGSVETVRYVKVIRYLDVPPAKGEAMVGDPAPHYQFHRSLSALLSPAFSAGFVLDALEEPAFGDDAEPGSPLGWSNVRTIPPVLGARFRVPGLRGAGVR